MGSQRRRVRLDEGGTVTIVSQHAAKEGVSSLGFCLSVESANAAGVEFQFGESGAKIKDYRYDEATGSLKVYLAGTEALFASGTDALTVGKIKVLDGSGNEMNATVSVVENSLQYVYGTELKTMQGVELPGAVQIGPAVVQPQPPSDPQPPSEPQPRRSLNRRRSLSSHLCLRHLWWCLRQLRSFLWYCPRPDRRRRPGPLRHPKPLRAPNRRRFLWRVLRRRTRSLRKVSRRCRRKVFRKTSSAGRG